MASLEVDGVRMPVLVAGHPAVEICNTRAGWGAPTPKEYLLSYRHLAIWARHAGLLPVVVPGDAPAVLRRVFAVRDELHAIFRGTPIGLSHLDAELRRLPAGLTPGSPPRWDYGTDVEAPLRAIVHLGAQLLVSSAAGSVGVCPGSGCGWAFYDPRGKRRWCIMAICGNRAKAARHAARTRS
ncbi:CGNR zinc finger domain-containing protein [Hamadaea tsunoensis]|uniref:CGNR zinc finger domain-containing protein n=1 Tax=Hamadaea tsunoensis TaxID=53368 RepID=UPI00041D3E15|nr:CGNR zinc finger domain-containing protein [Hamadaea tsunoensis]